VDSTNNASPLNQLKETLKRIRDDDEAFTTNTDGPVS